jgi:hypothetical protein
MVSYGFDRSIYWILTVTTTVIHFINLHHINRDLSSGSVSLHSLLKLSSCVTFACICLNCFYLCLQLLQTVFRQPSREHLVEGFGLSVVTKTTPPLCRKRLSMYALSRERVYNCHLDNDAYSALVVAVVYQWTAALIQL